MKYLILLLVFAFSQQLISQTITSGESMERFRDGNLNSITVIIPYASVKLVELQLKEELRDWGGKAGVSKGEYSITKGTLPAMGTETFDALAQVLSDKDDVVTIAVAININGVNLNSKDHPEPFDAMSGRMRIFALRCAKLGIEEQEKLQQKELLDLERKEKSLEAKKADLEENIANFEKKIVEAKEKIKENVKEQGENKEALAKQKQTLVEIEKKKTSLQ